MGITFMLGCNILATALKRQERHLIRILNRYGEFRGSGYRDVVVGRVEDVNIFLETLQREDPRKLRPLSQVVPLERTFQFDVSDFRERLKEAVTPYPELLENCRFYVRVKRRGHKGEISGLDMEKEMDVFILEALERTGKQAKIDFENPDKIIIVETVENWAGIGLITREMKEKCRFIRVK